MTRFPAPYDAKAHADRLGIPYYHRRISVNGMWIPERRTILLNHSLPEWHENVVCAHEVGHAVLGHRGCKEGSNSREELQANRWAARKLIRVERVAELSRVSPDPGVWAIELGVTESLLELWLSDNRRALRDLSLAMGADRQLEWA